jgi:serine/threonine-protein kinase
VVAPNALSQLFQVSEAGGATKPLTRLIRPDASHRWPQALPDGSVLFTAPALSVGSENARIEILPAQKGEAAILPVQGYYARYSPSGHLVFVRHGTLWAVKFDLNTRSTKGAPVALLPDLSTHPVTGGGHFAFSGQVSDPSVFAYLAGRTPAVTWNLAWLDASGALTPVDTPPGVYTNPRVSPDGSKLAFLNGPDIYVHELERGTTTRLTNAQVTVPVWMPDSKHLVYLSVSSGFDLTLQRSDGSAEPVTLLHSEKFVIPWSVAADGRRIAYWRSDSDTANDLWTLPLDNTNPDRPQAGTPERFLTSTHSAAVPRFSPDGRWMAYAADEEGQGEIYVRPFPAGDGGKWQVSSGGGGYPMWSRNGRELFYETPDHRVMAVDYRVEGKSFAPGRPRLWSPRSVFDAGAQNIDLAPDGKRFIVFTQSAAGSEPVRITVLLNFFDELKRRVP